MDRVLDEFLAEPFSMADSGSSSDSEKVLPQRGRQIVSLGAGLDSRYFRLWQDAKSYDNKLGPDAAGTSPKAASAAAIAAEDASKMPELPPLVVNGKVHLSQSVQSFLLYDLDIFESLDNT
jgi:hypothetical protein